MRAEAAVRATVVVAVVAVLAAGCSAAGTSQPTMTAGVSPTTTGSTTAVASTTTSSGVAEGLTPGLDPMALAKQYSLVSPDGEYVGPVDANGDPLLFEPITGYGDFSGLDRFDVDTYEVTGLIVECVRDQGFAVTLDPDGGIGYASVPPEQNQLADAAYYACKAGLHVPKPEPLTMEQLEKMYAYVVALVGCLESQGYSVADPPSLDAYIDSRGDWNPYTGLSVGLDVWVPLNRACPQNPVGGFTAWAPGDPILSMP
ncbi:hypothetical protein BMS3Bbin01_01173 [bacterium BMS3Bbin01]|nr:hypothetical protein BMS3Bbin01_01173 [bacterium BMS3Bbin01]